MAFFRATTSRPPAVPYTMRPTRRSMSPMPVRARASSSRIMVWSTSWPTAPLRRVMAVTDSRGRSSQLRSIRPPMGVLVLSSTQRRLPFFSLLRRVSVSSLLVIVQVVHMAQVGFLRLVEIVQQGSQRQRRRGIPLWQPSRSLIAELGADGPFRLLQLKASGAQPLHMAVELILHQTQQRPAVVGRLVHHRIRRGKPPQLVEQVLRPVRTLEGGDVGLAGGDVAHAEARAGVVQIQPRAEVGASLLQAGRVNDRAGGHHPDDVPVHQALGRGRVLGLLADGHLVALGNKPGNIGVRGLIGASPNSS